MRVLVTGGAGYIGSVLTEELLRGGHTVTVLDNLMYKQDGILHLFGKYPGFNFIYGDVRDTNLLFKWLDWADCVIPLAAIVGFPACERDKQGAEAINQSAVHQIAYHVATACKKMVIYPNTNSGYGLGQGESFCTENTPLVPISTYGVTKCKAEKAVLDNGGIALRLATVFGVSPRMRLDLLVNDFTYKAVTDGYIVLFEKDFKRNFIHVRDVVNAFIFMMNNYDKHRGEAFNVGLSSANLSKWELAQTIKKHIPGFSIQVDDIATDPDKRNYVVSNEKIEKAGWQPLYDLDAGIKELIQAYGLLKNVAKKYANV